jgi:transposase
LIRSEAVLGLPDYQITAIEVVAGEIRISAHFIGKVECPGCQGTQLRLKDRRIRRPRHESLGVRHSVLELETKKWQCRGCGRRFWQRFPGIKPRLRAT